MVENVWSPNCPMCNKENSDEVVTVDEDIVYVAKYCNSCTAEWVDVYGFQTVELYDKEDDGSPMFI